MSRYTNFTITIGPVGEKGLQIYARTGGPDAEAEATEFASLDRVPPEVRIALPEDVRGDVRDFSGFEGESLSGLPDPDVLGDALQELLFVGKVGLLFARVEAGGPLRIRLSFDFEESAALASLPWELARRDRNPIVLSDQATIVRSVQRTDVLERRPFNPPLRILLVASNAGLPLQLDREVKGIEKSLQSLPDVKLDTLVDPTIEDLNRQLVDRDYEIIHFMGHGRFRDGVGSLLLPDGELDAGLLRNMMLGERQTTRLVVLNACRTGEVDRAGRHAFGGVAATLVDIGLPAVVAMQYPVSDDAAIAFASGLYRSVAAGSPLEDAVREGRRGMIGAAPKVPEWATPVLYLRGTGSLFEPRQKTPAAIDRPAVIGRNYRNLLADMVDRREVNRALRDSLERQRATPPGPPIVTVIHGEEKQRVVNLIDRLQKSDLRAVLGLSDDDALERFALAWPDDLTDPAAIRKELIATLAQQVYQPPDFDTVMDYLLGLPGHVMIVTQVPSDVVARTDALTHYVDFWKSFPQRPGAERLFGFFGVTYERTASIDGLGLWKRRQANKANEAIEARNDTVRGTFEQLAAAKETGEGIILSVTKELDDVREKHLTDWADEWKQQDLLQDLLTAFRSRESKSQPMSVVVEDIERLIEEYDKPRGAVA